MAQFWITEVHVGSLQFAHLWINQIFNWRNVGNIGVSAVFKEQQYHNRHLGADKQTINLTKDGLTVTKI